MILFYHWEGEKVLANEMKCSVKANARNLKYPGFVIFNIQ